MRERYLCAAFYFAVAVLNVAARPSALHWDLLGLAFAAFAGFVLAKR